jgi:hypothetical protein
MREDKALLDALSSLTGPERSGMSAGLCGLTDGQLAAALNVTTKAASQVGYRVRRNSAPRCPARPD